VVGAIASPRPSHAAAVVAVSHAQTLDYCYSRVTPLPNARGNWTVQVLLSVALPGEELGGLWSLKPPKIIFLTRGSRVLLLGCDSDKKTKM